MAIVDPSADYIASQKEALTDFIFRVTGDRSRAGITATEVCEYVQRELMSAWGQQEIRIELFAYAFEVSSDAWRGIEKSFLESYYRHEIKDGPSVSMHYPVENFLLELGLGPSLTALLMYRFQFTAEECARILDKDSEDVDSDIHELTAALKKSPRIKPQAMADLPAYNFLSIPDHHPTALSHILVNIQGKRFSRGTRVFLTLILLGLLVGWVTYLLFY